MLSWNFRAQTYQTVLEDLCGRCSDSLPHVNEGAKKGRDALGWDRFTAIGGERTPWCSQSSRHLWRTCSACLGRGFKLPQIHNRTSKSSNKGLVLLLRRISVFQNGAVLLVNDVVASNVTETPHPSTEKRETNKQTHGSNFHMIKSWLPWWLQSSTS